MTEQGFQPAPPGRDIGVHERDEVGVAGGQPGVAGRRRTLAVGVAQHLDVAVRADEVFRLDGGRRTVVDHDDAQSA